MQFLTDVWLYVVLSSQTAPDSGVRAGARDALRSAVQDGHLALTDQRSRNAEQAFSQALSFLESNTHKVH